MDKRVLSHYDGDLSRVNRGQQNRANPGDTGDEVATEEPLAVGHPIDSTRRFRCPGCGYVYDERRGHPREGFPSGTCWKDIPDDWHCPECGVRDKVDFLPMNA